MARHALCIGINDYPGTDMDLTGCRNDADDWAAELRARGFEVRTLKDEEATRDAMLAAMREVVARGAAGDVVAITFSGHGTYVMARGDDEADGFDEALCPHDVASTRKPIVDNEVHAILAGAAPGVRLVMIADSCHSGTVTRAGLEPRADGLRPRFLPPAQWLGRGAALPAAAPPPEDAASPFATFVLAAAEAGAPCDDVLLAACEEGPGNFSFDGVMPGGRANGVFTYHALRALRTLPAGASYVDWYRAITPALLPSDTCRQTPQLVAGREAAALRRVFE